MGISISQKLTAIQRYVEDQALQDLGKTREEYERRLLQEGLSILGLDFKIWARDGRFSICITEVETCVEFTASGSSFEETVETLYQALDVGPAEGSLPFVPEAKA